MANYTEEELFGKLERADAAGDTEAATAIADEIRRVRSMGAKPARRVRGGAGMAEGFKGTMERQATRDAGSDGWKPGLVRDVMGGARSVIQGAGGLVGAFGGDAFNHFIVDPARRAMHSPNLSDVVKGADGFQPSPTYRDAAFGLADALGLPQRLTAKERVLGDVGEGLTGTGLTMGAGGGLASLGRMGTASPAATSTLARFLTAQPVQQVAATVAGTGASSMARENGAGPATQLLAGLGAGLGVGGLSALGGATTRGAARGSSGETMRRTIDDFAAVGATPSVGQASGRRSTQGFENLLGGLPMAEAPIANFTERQSRQIGEGLERTASSLTPKPSAEAAGRAIEQGTATFKNNVAAMRKALYWNVDQHIPDRTPVPMPSTWQTLDSLTSPTPGATATTSALVNSRLKAIRDNLAQDLAKGGGKIPYQALRAIRTRIGEDMEVGLLQQDTYTRQLSKVYSALSRDMEAAARSMGPAAAQAAKRANDYTHFSASRLEALQRVIDKNGGPEKVYQAAIGGTRDGGTTIRKVMQSLGADEQRAVTGAVIRRMGLAKAGQQGAEGDTFSAHTFLTNWNSMSQEARAALFNRHGPGFVKQMDQIARVAENIRTGSKVYANPPGTAKGVAGLGYLIALATSLGAGQFKTAGSLAGYGGMANLTARAMTNPHIVKWLANSTALPTGSAAAQIQTLRQIGEREQDEDVIAFADALEDRRKQ